MTCSSESASLLGLQHHSLSASYMPLTPDATRASADGLSDSVPTRACQSCRLSKVRCNQPSPGMPCARCQKSGKICIPAEQSVKRQKQSNSRMAELESRIDALATSIMQSYSLRERSDSHTNPSPTASSSPQADVTSRTSQKLLPSALSSPSNRDVNQGMRGSPLSMGPLAGENIVLSVHSYTIEHY